MTERLGWLKYLKILALAGLTVLSACGSGAGSDTPETGPIPSYLEVLPTGMAYPIGTTYQYRVLLNQFDGGERIVDVTAEATWAMDDTTVATVSSSGLVTAVAAGDAKVTASRNGLSASAAFRVTPSVDSIAVSPDPANIAVAATAQFAATATLSDSTTQNLSDVALWSSSDTTVVTVDAKGLATGVAPGQATITASCPTASVCSSLSASAQAIVKPALVSIAVTAVSSHLIAGNSQQFVATGTYADNSVAVITTLTTWTSDAAAVATVGNEATNKGVVTAVSGGNANIAATLGSVSGSLRMTAYPPAF